MVTSPGTILSSPNRLFFFITLVVFLIVVYLLHHMGDPSSVKMHILPNYDKTFELPDHNNPALPHQKRQISRIIKPVDHSIHKSHNQRQPSSPTPVPDDAAIFYIDPPDKPVRPKRPRQSLVGKHLQHGEFGMESSDDELEENRSNDLVQNVNQADNMKYQNQKDDDLAKNQNQNVNNQEVQSGKQYIEGQPMIDNLKLELDIMKGEHDSLVEEWQKLREEQHKLLEDKIRFKKEVSVGNWQTRDPLDLLYRRHLLPTNPIYWESLNSSVVELRYPGILFSREYTIQPFINPSDKLAAGMERHPVSVKNMTDGQAENRFYQLLTQTHLACGDIKRLGNTEDGGWDICLVEPYFPKKGCLVYSFGINYDFTFDDSMAETFGCEVRTFDPSMLVGDHMHQPTVFFYQLGLGAANTVNDKGWKLETMGSILKKLDHLGKTIDILKLDIEFSEWGCFRTMLKEGVLRNIKQLVMEIHTPEVYVVGRPSNKDDFFMMYNVLYGLEKQGFRKFHFTYNPLGKYQSVRTGKSRTCCYELYYVNIKFLKT